MTLKDKVTSVVTGDAYDKPAKTEDGAMTTQDAPNAATVKGTSADPNPPEPEKSKLQERGESMANNAADKAGKAQEKARQNRQQAADKCRNQAMKSGSTSGQKGAAQDAGNMVKDKAQEQQGKANSAINTA